MNRRQRLYAMRARHLTLAAVVSAAPLFASCDSSNQQPSANFQSSRPSDNEGSYQHLPTCMGGQGRSDAEIESWGETLCSFFTILGVGLVVGVVMFVAAIVAKGGV